MSTLITEMSEVENKVEPIQKKELGSKAYPSEKCVQENDIKKSEETCSMKKETKSSKKTTGTASKICKHNESSGHENSLVKWLKSCTPQKKASSSEEQKQGNAEDITNKQKKIKDAANASVKDDALRIKTRVKYLLKRINQEQNFIDAYAADGWKGQRFVCFCVCFGRDEIKC